ncbi:MAG: hypothetical protein E6178_05240, partial [Streptococcus sp.]|nr:hypothetical protein [Streptococcus sp.]
MAKTRKIPLRKSVVSGEIIDKFNDMSEEEQKNLEELKKNSPIYNPNMNKPKEQENSNNEKQ